MTQTAVLKKLQFAKASKNFLIYIGIFLLIYTGLNYLRQPVMPANASLQFISIDNKAMDLAKMSEEQAVLVYFWGNWCGVCRQTSPMVQSLNSPAYPVVSVAVQSGDDIEVEHYTQQHQLDFAVINDSDGAVFRAWQGQVTPSYVIVSQGKVVQAFTGLQPAWVLKMRMALANELGE